MKFLLALIFVSILNNCASPGVGPNGFLYSNVKLAIYSNGEKATTISKRCIHSVFGLFAYGDASIAKTKELGNLRIVTDINWELKSYLGLYASLCVLVGGKI